MKVLRLVLSSSFLCQYEAHNQLPVNRNMKPGLCTAGLVVVARPAFKLIFLGAPWKFAVFGRTLEEERCT